MVQAVQPQAQRNIRAVIFLNSPGRYFEQQLVPRTKEFNIDVERYVFMDKSKSFDVSGCQVDVFIALTDMLGRDQYRYVRELSRKHNIRFVGLTRRGDWSNFLRNVPLRPLPPPPSKNVVQLRPAVKESPMPKLTDAERELPSAPPLSESDFEDLLSLYQGENDELLAENKKLTQTVSAREDAILISLEKEEKAKAQIAELEKRLKDQIDIRAQSENELRDAKEALDALARQLQEEHQAPPPHTLPPPADNPRSLAAMKAHNTRLKNDLAVSQQAQVETAKALVTLRAEVDALRTQKGGTTTEIVLNKEDLINWGNAIRDVVTGNPAGYRTLLELAHKYNVDVKSLIDQIS